MLTPSTTDFGYTTVQEYPQHHSPAHTPSQHSSERPKLYGLESTHSMMSVHDYHQPMLPHHHPHVLTPHEMTPHHHTHVMTPQHPLQHVSHHPQGVEYDHEPLAIHVTHPQQQYYGPNAAHMLLVSSDYGYNSGVSPASVDGTTPRPNKRSRADLNMKEKKRMFKLNDRINQLKELLDDAGIQCKKNKQSVLDNAVHFIDQLRSDLVIAKQKADLAEKEAEVFKAKAKKAIKENDANVWKSCFTQSSMARIIVDLDMKPVSMNPAFLAWSGHEETFLQTKEHLKQVLCADNDKLEALVQQVCVTNKPTSSTVDATTNTGVVSCMLMLSPVINETGKPSQIEFSWIPTQSESVVEINIKPEVSTTTPVDSSETVVL